MRSSFLLSLVGIYLSGAQETCYMPIDVVFVQDTTGSFDDDLPNVVRQIPSMTQQILSQNPESHFAVVEFKDKPYYPLGDTDDFCYKLNGNLTPDIAAFQEAYGYLYASGGGDLPEASFQALINAATDVNVGWRSLSRPVRGNEAGARLMILSTDAVPHLPGDIDRMYGDYETVPHDLPDFDFLSSPDEQCRRQDYPASGQLKKVLIEQNIYLAILTPNDPAIVAAWKWLNEDLLQQPPDFYQFITSDSSDIIQAVLAAIKAVTETACAQTLPPSTAGPTTTPAPTTVVPTTVLPTTTTTTTLPPTTTTTTTLPPTTTTTTTTLPPTTTTTTTLPPTTTTTTTTTLPPTTTTTTTTTLLPTTTTTTTLPPTTTTTTTLPPTTTTTTTLPPTTTTTTTLPPTTTTTTTLPLTTTTTTLLPTTTTTTTLPLTTTTTTTLPPTTTTTTTLPTTTATTTTTTLPTTTTTTTTLPPTTSTTTTTTLPLTSLPATLSDATVSPAGSTECPPCPAPPCAPCHSPCSRPCAPGHHDPCCWDIVIKISDRPENVHIEMGSPKP